MESIFVTALMWPAAQNWERIPKSEGANWIPDGSRHLGLDPGTLAWIPGGSRCKNAIYIEKDRFQ